jgi:ParB-like chromosome segregation protein Spo0J
MSKLLTQNTAGSNAGSTFLSKMVRVSDIVIDPEIAGIFDISEKTLDKITERIRTFGFYKEEPVVIWKGTNTLVDGRTRYTAAKNAGLEEIPAVEREFESKEAAIHYTIERQVYRRNLTGAEILKVTKLLPEERNRKGEGNAARQLAEETGVSESTIHKARKILKKGSPEVVEKVESGEMSIKDAYQETVGKKNKPSATKALDLLNNSIKCLGSVQDELALLDTDCGDPNLKRFGLSIIGAIECLKTVEKGLTILE